MTRLTAVKYNPDNDPHYPKVGDLFDEGRRRITKVKHIETGELMKMFDSNDLPEDSEHLTVFNNPERPFLKYLVWFEEVVTNPTKIS